MAARTASSDSPIAESRSGCNLTRIAGCSAPLTFTSATPSTCAIRWAITVSATSYIAEVDIVGEVRARMRTGAAAGFALRKMGRFGRSDGRSVAAAFKAAWTSRAALSGLRLSSNCTAIDVVPREDCDVISVTPAIAPSRRSRGAATVAAMVAGSAPGRLALTRMVGRSTDGRLATGKKAYATAPTMKRPMARSAVPTGRRMKISETFTSLRRLPSKRHDRRVRRAEERQFRLLLPAPEALPEGLEAEIYHGRCVKRDQLA